MGRRRAADAGEQVAEHAGGAEAAREEHAVTAHTSRAGRRVLEGCNRVRIVTGAMGRERREVDAPARAGVRWRGAAGLNRGRRKDNRNIEKQDSDDAQCVVMASAPRAHAIEKEEYNRSHTDCRAQRRRE